MAASSARLIVCLSGCDLVSMCVVVCVRGFTIAAPNVGLPVFCDPSVYMKALGSHAAMNWWTGYRMLPEVCGGVTRHGSMYEWLLSICCASFLRRLRKIVGGCCLVRLASSSRRV